jgi:hypothetical protein
MNVLGLATLTLLGIFFLLFATYHLDGVVDMRLNTPQMNRDELLRLIRESNMNGIQTWSDRQEKSYKDCRLIAYLNYVRFVHPEKGIRVKLHPEGKDWEEVWVLKDDNPVYKSTSGKTNVNDDQLAKVVSFVNDILLIELAALRHQDNPNNLQLPTLAHVLVRLVNGFIKTPRPKKGKVDKPLQFLRDVSNIERVDETTNAEMTTKWKETWVMYHMLAPKMGCT